MKNEAGVRSCGCETNDLADKTVDPVDPSVNELCHDLFCGDHVISLN